MTRTQVSGGTVDTRLGSDFTFLPIITLRAPREQHAQCGALHHHQRVGPSLLGAPPICDVAEKKSCVLLTVGGEVKQQNASDWTERGKK